MRPFVSSKKARCLNASGLYCASSAPHPTHTSTLSVRHTVLLIVLVVVAALHSGCATSGSVLLDASSGAESGDESTTENSGETAEHSDRFEPGDIREVSIPGTPVSVTLVWVPGGSYRVGTEEAEVGRESDEGPIVDVELGGFWMMQTEVTDDAYNIFRFSDRDSDVTNVEGAAYDVDAVTRPSPPYEDPAFGMGGEGKPAVGMTQWGALQFAKWMTEKTGVFFRLPSEAEWEVACRVGRDPESMSPASGAMLDRAAWYEENSELLLQPVAGKRANTWGLYDMLGNVAEWMLDEYVPDYHAQIAGRTDPWIEPTRLHPRTVRGGAYDEGAGEMRCGARLESTTDWKRRDPQIPKSYWWNTDSPFLGFRLVAPDDRPNPDDEAFFWSMVLGE